MLVKGAKGVDNTRVLFQYMKKIFMYEDSHDKDKIVARLSYLYNGNPYS